MARIKTPPPPTEQKPDAERERSGNPGAELERSGGSGAGAVQPSTAPDPEFTPQRRRHFTAAYKRRILLEAESCKERGELGSLLRKEGLYSSNLISWRKEFESGGLSALAEKRRGRPPQPVSPLQERVAQLEREKAQLEARLKQAEFVIDVQKKVSQALGLAMANGESV